MISQFIQICPSQIKGCLPAGRNSPGISLGFRAWGVFFIL